MPGFAGCGNKGNNTFPGAEDRRVPAFINLFPVLLQMGCGAAAVSGDSAPSLSVAPSQPPAPVSSANKTSTLSNQDPFSVKCSPPGPITFTLVETFAENSLDV